MKTRQLLCSLVCLCVFVFANASNDSIRRFEYAGGDGSSPQKAIRVLGGINQSEHVSAIRQWHRERYPDAKPIEFEFPCINKKRFSLLVLRLKFGIEKEFYFDESQVRDNEAVKGKEFEDRKRQLIETIKNANLPADTKEEIIAGIMRDQSPQKKARECGQ